MLINLTRTWAMRSEDKSSRDLKSRREFYLELIRKNKTRVVAKRTLFAANSTPEVYFAQLSYI